jgi:hypothetical protein
MGASSRGTRIPKRAQKSRERASAAFISMGRQREPLRHNAGRALQCAECGTVPLENCRVIWTRGTTDERIAA